MRPTVVRSRCPCSMPVNRARLVLSQSCSVLRSVVNRRLSIIVLMLSLSSATSPQRLDLNGAGEIALGDGRGDFGDGAHLVGEVVGQQIYVAGEVLPRAGRTRDICLSAEPAFDTDLTGHSGHLIGKGGKRVGHVVDGLGEGRHFALGIHRELLREFAVRDCRHHFHDAAHLLGEVYGHHVDVVGEVLPGAGDVRHIRLTTKPAFGANFARDARHLAGEGVELIDHRVDGVLQLENLALHVDRDLAREIAASHGGRDFGDVADLSRQIAGHEVDRVGEILPRAGDTGNVCLAAESALRYRPRERRG